MANSLMNNKLHTKITLLSLILLLYPLVTNSYNPDYNLAINCGSSKNATASDNRTWVGDNFDPITYIDQKPIYNPLNITKVPYTTARFFFSNFTYSIPINITNNSTVFLRLHFYPTSYQNFDPSNAIFSVKVNNNLTLLKNFNASLWLHHDDNGETIIKEYCIQIKPNENLLNITFIPYSIDESNRYYAFINGIEIVSMPSFLYYSDLDDLNYNIRSVDTGTTDYKIQKDKALEMVYRVNVGDIQVPPSNDTGMFRNWDNDYPLYLEKQYPYSVQNDYGDQLNYLENTIPNYTAPELVYLTARTYGLDAKDNYNVTWNFEVDSSFTYMVRLYFCEFEQEIKQVGDRVFQIFIDNTLAEEYADVIMWSGARLVPVHKDYVVTMYSQEGSSKIERVNLSIKLQLLPANINNKRYFRDVLLNGIEILKISGKNKNLAGPNPKSIALPLPHQVVSTQSIKKNKITIAILVVIPFLGLVLVIVVGKTVSWLWRRFHGEREDNSKTKNEGSLSLPPHLCRYFTITEIRAATNNFDDVFIIGVGGFGNVYKGCIDGSTPVAIKRLKSGSQQGANEFMNEIELLSQLRHVHLVSLVGYCNDDTEMILVYEFMQHGTLCEYLYGSNNHPLPWKQRLEILLGAAKGLHYLHAEVKHKIIHRDVKSTNILLDEKWVAKVSDFGLSKVGPTGISTTHVSTMVKGSLGYLDPEYYMFQRLTLKSDVYSFGVVLLEVLCARPPLVRDLDKKTASLVCWFQKCYDEGVAIEQIVDPFLRDSITGECLKCYCKLALSCLHDDGTQRPTMSQVVGDLEFALQLVVSEEGSQFGKAEKEGRYMKGPQFSQFMSDEESDLHFVRSHTYKESTLSAWPSSQEHPFSEIPNPRPRSYSCQNLKVYI
ncbi:receptor-like protein kinase FERONIA [Trifolium pratense]|uniref:receptor-like protein kinase FERONIA n=1 Tax=Trifolium pratense TaxID=57577 RepID=UPI001E697B7F|nr:receptor-like protein kinase FERONIA [Trifolium pratense]